MDSHLSAKTPVRIGIVITIAVLAFMGLGAAAQLARDPGPRLLYALLYILCAVLLAAGAAWGLQTHPKAFLAFFALVSFGAALAVALWAKTEPMAEYERMFQAALNIRNGQWDVLRQENYFLVWAYQSGFVLFEALVLRLLPPHIVSLLVVNALAMAGINITLYILLRRVCSTGTAIFISMLYLCAPPPYFLASVLTNQHISLFLLLLGLCLTGRGIGKSAAAGLCLALACAIRPDAALVYPALGILAVLLFFYHRENGAPDLPAKKAWQSLHDLLRAVPGGLVLSVAAGVVTGFLLSGLVMLSGLNPYGLQNRDPWWKLAVGLNIETEGRFSTPLAEYLLSAEDPADRAVLEREIVRDNLSQGLPAMASFLLKKLGRSWSEYETPSWAFFGQDARLVPLLRRPLSAVLPILQQAERWLLFLLAAVGCFGLVKAFRSGASGGAALCGLVVVGFVVIHVLIEFQPRYRYMLWPFVYGLAAIGVSPLLGHVKRMIRHRESVSSGAPSVSQ